MFTWRWKAEPKIHLSLSTAQDKQGRKAALPLSLGKGTEVIRKSLLGMSGCVCVFHLQVCSRVLQNPAFLQSDFPCWFQISYCSGKQKGKHQRARSALNQFILSPSLFCQLVSIYPQRRLINPTLAPKLDQAFCSSVAVWVSDMLKEASTTCTPSRNWILERRKLLNNVFNAKKCHQTVFYGSVSLRNCWLLLYYI